MFTSSLSRLASRLMPAPARTWARSFHSSMPVSAGVLVQHRNTPENNPETKFEWTPESKQELERILTKYPSNYKQSATIPLLTLAQKQNGNFLTLSAMNKIAETLQMPPIRVYEVATFYTMFNRTKVGKYHLQVCGTTPCQLCGAEKIIETIENHLGIQNGDTTEDGMFTLQEVECLGACVNAPMMQINNEWFYEDLTPENTIRLLEDLRAGREVRRGPQNHRKNCEGPQGKTSLHSEPKGPHSRDLQAAKEQYQKKLAEAAAAAAAAKK